MKELANLKKGNLFHNGPVIYKIVDNNLQEKIIKIIRYEVYIDAHLEPRQMRFDAGSHWSRPYKQLENDISFVNSVEMDEDVMQGFIMGIFGELD